MNESRPPRPSARTRRLLPLSLAVILAVVLAWQRPWQARPAVTPRPVSLAPTPAPPTPTTVPDRVVPPPAAAATAARATPATPAAAPIAELAGAGSLLYLGFVEGHPGIVSVNADGSDRRLLVPGMYDTLAWSPDGSRFAAAGPLPGSGVTYQIAIFAADGRPLARFPFNNNPPRPLSWSPSGRFLLTSSLGGTGTTGFETWVLGEDGARQIPTPPRASGVPLGWTPDERIAFLVTGGTVPPGTAGLLTADARGWDWRNIYQGRFVPLGWDATGTKFTFLASSHINASEGPLDVLSTIDTVTHVGSTRASASDLAADVLGETGGSFAFTSGIGAPDGKHFAVTLVRNSAPATPKAGEPLSQPALVFLSLDDPASGAERLQNPGELWPYAWSPDSKRLAHLVYSENNLGELRILDTTAALVVTYPISRHYGAGPIAVDWSPDSRWIAYNDDSGITIAATTGSTHRYLLAPAGIAPAWRPAPHP
jgi:WD40 repeat protein